MSRIPDLCPDCHGSGGIGSMPSTDDDFRPCLHPNAPTIADLLRWGENVAKCSVEEHSPTDAPYVRIGDLPSSMKYAVNLLAALRTEADR